MIQSRPRAAFLSLVAALTLATAVGVGCSGGGGDDDDDDDGATTPTPACTPLPNFNLSTLQSAIFSQQCGNLASCHDSVVPESGIDMTSAQATHDSLVGVLSMGTYNGTQMVLVSAGNAAASYLYYKVSIQGQDENPGSPMSGGQMPDTGQPLCAEKIDAIEAWINAGAQNN